MTWYVEEWSGEGFVVTDGVGAATAPTDMHIVASLMCDYFNRNNIRPKGDEFWKIDVEDFEEAYEELMDCDFS